MRRAIAVVVLAGVTTAATYSLMDRHHVAQGAEITTAVQRGVVQALAAARTSVSPAQASVMVAMERPRPNPVQMGKPGDPKWQQQLAGRLAQLPATAQGLSLPVGTADWRSATKVPIGPYSFVLHGIVRYPQVPGRHPFVLLMPGNHGQCRSATGGDRCMQDVTKGCPADEMPVDTTAGLVWAADLLASRGWIAEVVDTTPLVCAQGPEAVAVRAEILMAHLRRWEAWHAGVPGELTSPVTAQADLTRVALVGHSTGADGVLAAAALLQHPESNGLGNVQLRSIALVAPTDQVEGPPPPVEMGIILPTCDFDVYPLRGRALLDRADVGQPGTRMAMWLLGGGSHNAFNQSWRDETVDIGLSNCDPGYRLGGDVQRVVLGRLVADWLQAGISGEPLPEWLYGRASPPIAAAIDLRSVVLRAGRRTPDQQRIVSDGVDSLTACEGRQCPSGVTRELPTWLAAWSRQRASLTWSWAAGDPASATHAQVRIAALDGSPRDRPLLLRGAWLDASGRETPAGTAEVLPPLDQAAEINEVGTRPWPLAAIELPLPTGKARSTLAGLRIYLDPTTAGVIAFGDVSLVSRHLGTSAP